MMKMDNNDILIRLRYALNIREREMVKIYEKGGVDITEEDVLRLLKKTESSYNYDANDKSNEDHIVCTNANLESFLNGLIVHKRGVRKNDAGEVMETPMVLADGDNPNNVLLKKVKIALDLNSMDMISVFKHADVEVSKSELSAFFRKKGHKHYRTCMDKYARSFLKGLTVLYKQ